MAHVGPPCLTPNIPPLGAQNGVFWVGARNFMLKNFTCFSVKSEPLVLGHQKGVTRIYSDFPVFFRFFQLAFLVLFAPDCSDWFRFLLLSEHIRTNQGNPSADPSCKYPTKFQGQRFHPNFALGNYGHMLGCPNRKIAIAAISNRSNIAAI